MEPTQNQNVFQSPTSAQPLNPVVPLPPKKFVPKKIFVWIGVAVAIFLAVFLVIKLFGSKEAVSGELVWWGLWEDENVIAPIINEYQSKNPKVKIKYINQSPRDYRERLTSAFAKGTGPDIFRFHNSWVPMFVRELDSLPASVMNPADFAKSFYQIASSDLTLGSGIIGIPLEYDALALFINQDIFDKSGKSAPATWDDLRDLAKELTVKDDQGAIVQSGIALGRVENVDHWQEILALMMIQNGVDLTKPVGKQAEDALTFFTIFSSIDGVWDATLPTSTAAFAGGKLAMYFGPSWRAFEIKGANPNLKFKTIPVPQLPKDRPNEPDITYATYWAEGVWARSSKKSQAWDFLKFLSEKETLQKLYQSESKVRDFGEPYPLVEMGSLLKDHPVLGSIITQAPEARSWYLASRTFDGPTGINSLLSKYFEDAVVAVGSGKSAAKALETVSQGVQQVLSQYRLTK